MSGLFCAAFLRRIGWDVDVYERSPIELVGRGAGITTHPELLDALEQCGAGTRDLGIEVSKRITIDRGGSRHRRAGIASDPHLLGSPAATAARNDRSCVLPPRAHLRARRAGGQRGCGSISPKEASNAQTCLWAATASAPACAPKSRRKCSRSIPAITSGAERRTSRTWRPRTLASIFPYFVLFLPRAPAGDRLSDLGVRQRLAPRPPALQLHLVSCRRCTEAQETCASTKAAISTNTRCRHRSSAAI